MKKIIYKGRNKKFIWLLIISICVTLLTIKLLLIPWEVEFRQKKDPHPHCLQQNSPNLVHLIQNKHAVLAAARDQPNYAPFVSNGFLGAVANGDSVVYLRDKQTISFPIPVYPFVNVIFPGQSLVENISVISLIGGVVHHLQCYEEVWVHQQFLAHRTHPSLLIQSIWIVNPTNVAVEFHFEKPPSPWPTSSWHNASVQGNKPFIATASQIDYEGNSAKLAIAVLSSKHPARVLVQPSSSTTVWLATNIATETALNFQDLQQSATKAWQKVQSQQHHTAWQKLWQTNFGISQSLAKDALNGDQINATLYYVLSQVRAPLHELDEPAANVAAKYADLNDPDPCYEGHHTLQASMLWTGLTNVAEIAKVTNYWLLTLMKKGCDRLVSVGADGIMQAMVLSFGAFRFTHQHLECNMHPNHLHRDMVFHHIRYGPNSHLTIKIYVREDNKAELTVSLMTTNQTFYACDAGCLDQPQKLGREPRIFPIKLTDPLTPILYVASEKTHLEELKHTIHVQLVMEAPAHEHHLLALHRHGHSLGGLPLMFWVSLIFLVSVFHLFLLKLIYTEYKREQQYHLVR